MTRARRARQAGVVLVTILVVMALCVTVIVAMTTRSERATRTMTDDLSAGQARALVAAGEASALAALLRDLENPPEADGPREAWAHLAQTDIAIAGGRFELHIADEAARFNLNTLTLASPWSRSVLGALVARAGLEPEVAQRIASALKGGKPLLRLTDLGARAGLSGAEMAALAPFVTCTPDLNGGINVNTAPADLLAILIDDPDTLSQLLALRETGLITTTLLADQGLVLPEGLTLRSDVFTLTITVAMGDARVTAVSTIHRWRDSLGKAHAVVSQRKLGAV